VKALEICTSYYDKVKAARTKYDIQYRATTAFHLLETALSLLNELPYQEQRKKLRDSMNPRAKLTKLMSDYHDILGREKLSIKLEDEPEEEGVLLQKAITNNINKDSSNFEVIRNILDTGVDPNVLDPKGDAPLHNAVQTNNLELTKLLIERGAQINALNGAGESLGHIIVKNMKINKELLKFIIIKGLDVTLQDKRGFTVPHLIEVKSGLPRSISVIELPNWPFNYSRYLNSKQHSDIILLVENTKIYAHKIILSQSEMLRTLVESDKFQEANQKEILLPDCSSKAFLKLLEYLYSGEFILCSLDLTLEVLVLSCRFLVTPLLRYCQYLVSRLVTTENAIPLFEALIPLTEVEELRKLMAQFILANYNVVGTLDSNNSCLFYIIDKYLK
jgi:hypothetical protein